MSRRLAEELPRLCEMPPLVHEQNYARAALKRAGESNLPANQCRPWRHVAVVTAHNRRGLTLLEESLRFFGVAHQVLRVGRSQQWNHLFKVQAFHHYLLSAVAEQRLVLFCDADDCALVREPDLLVRRYNELGAPPAVFMSTSFAKGYPTEQSRQWAASALGTQSRHLNSGVIMGERGYLARMVGEVVDVARRVRQRRHPIWQSIRAYYESDEADILIPDQNIFRYLHPRFPDAAVDVANRLAWRNGPW